MQNSFTLKDPKIALGKPSKKQNYKFELFKLARAPPPPPPFNYNNVNFGVDPPPPLFGKSSDLD